MKKPETRFKEKVLKDLRLVPHSWFTKIQQQAIAGTPDILGCVVSVFVAIELKKDERSHPTDLQGYELTKIKHIGQGLAIVTSPETWPEVHDFLIELGQDNMRGMMAIDLAKRVLGKKWII